MYEGVLLFLVTVLFYGSAVARLTVDDLWNIDSCVDLEQNCTTHPDLMDNNCPGYCCKDVWDKDRCHDLKVGVGCYNDIGKSQRKCAVSCGFCCIDLKSNCETITCDPRDRVSRFRCAKTCKYCPATPGESGIYSNSNGEEMPVETCGIVAIDEPRIIGGNEAAPGQHPWYVFLYDRKVMCGGTIVGKRWVTTAAHCLRYNLKAANWTGLVGAVTLNFENKIYFEKIIQHHGFSSTTMVHDIALFKTTEDIVYTDYILPICLPTSNNDVTLVEGDKLTVIGFGVTSPGDTEISDKLMQVDVPFVTETECRAIWGITNGERYVCAGAKGVDSCSGDSGGALILQLDNGQNVLVGIVSRGSPECGNGDPALYANVNYYLNWISTTIKNNS